MSTATNPERIHVGRNIKRYREMAGIKQQSMATDLGDGWNQKMIAQLEEKEEIADDILEKVAKILNIPMETLKNHEPANGSLNIHNNTYEQSDHFVTYGNGTTNNQTNDLTETLAKIIEMHEENKVLYERIIKEKEEMIALLMKGK